MTTLVRFIGVFALTLTMAQMRASIAGRVADDEGRPIRHAVVSLVPAGQMAPVIAIAETNDAGAFMIDGVDAGRYTLRAEKPAFLLSEHGAKQAGHAGTAISLAAGDRRTGLDITLWRGAVVTGVVRAGDGAPVGAATVNVLQYASRNGERVLISPTPLARQFTDAGGAYRIYGLPPGETVVVASPPTAVAYASVETVGFAVQTSADIERAKALAHGGRASTGVAVAAAPEATPPRLSGFAPVFFPGSPDVDGASVFHLSAGEERRGVDITMSRVAVASVTGRLQFRDGTPAGSVNIVASTSDAATPEVANATGRGSSVVRTGADGTFTLPNLVPGRYHVTARYADPRATDRPPLWADTTMQISGEDLTLTLTLQTGAAVRGTLTLVGEHPPEVPIFTVTFTGSTSTTGTQPTAMFSDGRFATTALAPDHYRIGLRGPDRLVRAKRDRSRRGPARRWNRSRARVRARWGRGGRDQPPKRARRLARRRT